MSTPLAATWRLVFPVTVISVPHLQRHYLDVTPSGDVTGYDVVDRLGAGGIGVSDVAEAYLTLIAPVFKADDTAYGAVELQQLSGIAWLPIVSYTPAAVPTSVAATQLASQVTLSMRDTAFHKVHPIFLESTRSVPGKTTNVLGFGGAWQAIAEGFTKVQLAASNLPWLWVRGRSDLYLGSYVSLVADTNDKVRRRRGLA